MLRCYEKGFEILGKVPESLRSSVTHFDQNRVEDIYRVEVEFKAETKHIPWLALTERDEAFAGAYPFCAELLPDVAHVKFQTLPDFRPQMELETALDHCHRAYGGILRAALLAHGGDADKVLQRVVGLTPSRALIEAGVLTCEHR
jgi:DNA relaxase NicK